MGRKAKAHAFRVLCIKDDKVYYIQINKDNTRTYHHFDNPIPYREYLKSKTQQTFDNNTSISSQDNTEVQHASNISASQDSQEAYEQKIINQRMMFSNPNFETCRDDEENETVFDGNSLYKDHKVLDGTVYTYDPSAFC